MKRRRFIEQAIVGGLGAIALVSLFVACERKPLAPSPAASAPTVAAQTITVFAAASTVDVMNEAARLFAASHGVEVKCSFDSSSTLAKQIIAGAPADVFISADEEWMDEAEKANAIDAASRTNLLGNALVLVAAADRSVEVKAERGFDFAAVLPAGSRIAIADPAHVPAGRYAKQSLKWLGWWATVEPRMIAGQDVRATLRLVESGEADMGIVYSTDAKAAKKSSVVATLPAQSHDAIRYPVAITRDAGSHAREFIMFLRSDEMKAIFDSAGFIVLTGEQ